MTLLERAPSRHAQVNNGSFDNCVITTLALDKMNFDLRGRRCQHGDHDGDGYTTATREYLYFHGHGSEDNVAPTAICQNLTVQLDATGAGSITAAQVNNGSSDNCGIATMTLDQTDFDCTDVRCQYGDLDGDRCQQQREHVYFYRSR